MFFGVVVNLVLVGLVTGMSLEYFGGSFRTDRWQLRSFVIVLVVMGYAKTVMDIWSLYVQACGFLCWKPTG